MTKWIKWKDQIRINLDTVQMYRLGHTNCNNMMISFNDGFDGKNWIFNNHEDALQAIKYLDEMTDIKSLEINETDRILLYDY